jgi:two-component system, chemotaxis family, chemotaxis protein CheY
MAHILVVDDSRSIRELARGVLEGAGYTVATAADGVEGMQQVRSQQFDLVLSDVNMPNMDGMSFVFKLRRLENYQDVPVLMVTTESADNKKERARTSGANGWLQKPFDPERLLAAVGSLVGQRPSPRQAAG